MKYRKLKLGETKKLGDELRGYGWLGRKWTWFPVYSELASRVSKKDLKWGAYRRPIKAKGSPAKSPNKAKAVMPKPMFKNGACGKLVLD